MRTKMTNKLNLNNIQVYDVCRLETSNMHVLRDESDTRATVTANDAAATRRDHAAARLKRK